MYVVGLSPSELHTNVICCLPLQEREAFSSTGWQILNMLRIIESFSLEETFKIKSNT